MAEERPLEVLLVSDPADARWRERLQAQLAPLVVGGRLTLWDESCVLPGSYWREALQAAVDRARLAVVFGSADLLSSQQIRAELEPRLLKAARAGTLQLLWIPVLPALFELSWLEPFKPLWDHTRPLSGLSDGPQEKALLEIVRRLSALVKPSNPGNPPPVGNPAAPGATSKAGDAASSGPPHPDHALEYNPARGDTAGGGGHLQAPPPVGPVSLPPGTSVPARVAGATYLLVYPSGRENELEVQRLKASLDACGLVGEAQSEVGLVGEVFIELFERRLETTQFMIICTRVHPGDEEALTLYRALWTAALELQQRALYRGRVLPVKLFPEAVGVRLEMPLLLSAMRQADWAGDPGRAVADLLRAMEGWLARSGR